MTVNENSIIAHGCVICFSSPNMLKMVEILKKKSI